MRKMDKLSKVACEDKCNRRDRPTSRDHKIRPAVKKTKRLAVNDLQVFVQTTRLRHLRRKLTLRERSKKCEYSRNHPYSEEKRSTPQRARHSRRGNENSGPDH